MKKVGTPGKIEDETKKPRIFSMNLRNKELITWMNKNKNYVMLILHQFKLMTIHGFGILLILVVRMKIDIAQLEKVFNDPPVVLKQRLN